MNLPDPNLAALVRLSRKLVQAGWCDQAAVIGEKFDCQLTALGKSRFQHLADILRELDLLDVEEKATLESLALEFAKQHERREGF